MRRLPVAVEPTSFLTLCCAVRSVGKGIPWISQGTMLDLTASSRFQQLADIQQDLDRRAGRPISDTSPTNTVGPVVMGADGRMRPIFPAANAGSAGPFAKPRSVHDKVQLSEEEVLAIHQTPHEELSEDRQIRQLMQHWRTKGDSFGYKPRGVIRPPPSPAESAPETPREYRQKSAELGPLWYGMVSGMVVMFVLMVIFGK